VYERHFKFIKDYIDIQNKKADVIKLADQAMGNYSRAVTQFYD
jgi:hypothetical protein